MQTEEIFEECDIGTLEQGTGPENRTNIDKDQRAALLVKMRARTRDIMDKLRQEAMTAYTAEEEEIDPPPYAPHSVKRRFINKHGFVKVNNYADEDEIQAMKSKMKDLVDQLWDISPPPRTCASSNEPDNDEKSSSNESHNLGLSVFRTDEKQMDAQGSDDYFLRSATGVHFFAETDALDDKGLYLKEEFRKNKMAALNKVGHAVHLLPGVFRDFSTSKDLQKLTRELGWIDPVVPQSMYIFKQAGIGGVVTSHQDSTFLYTTPRQTCLGVWLALDDATVENGCMWVRPGSHKEPVRRRFKRNPEHFGDLSAGVPGDKSKPQLIFETLVDEAAASAVPWDGTLPERSTPCPPANGLFDAGFIPIECKAGDLLLFPGNLDHLSLPNTSNAPRHTFQLHIVEGPECGIKWSSTNWLQYPDGAPFLDVKKG